MQNYYETEDFNLASWLNAKGLDLREVAVSDPIARRCKFIFRIDESDPQLILLLKEWADSAACAEIRRVQYAMKRVNYALKECKTRLLG